MIKKIPFKSKKKWLISAHKMSAYIIDFKAVYTVQNTSSQLFSSISYTKSEYVPKREDITVFSPHMT